jgi:hypothetical protein
LNDQAMEAETDALIQQVMPDAYAAMMRNREAQALIPAPCKAAGTNVPPDERRIGRDEPPPDLTVKLYPPEAFRRAEDREAALASLASLSYATAVRSYQKALATNGDLSAAHALNASRQSFTVAALVEALNSAPKPSNPPKQRTVPIRSSRETWNAYHRDLMRKRSALRRLDA